MADYELTAAEAYAQLRVLKNEPSVLITDNDDILTWLNEFALDIGGHRTKVVEASTIEALTANKYEYTMSDFSITDLFDVEAVLYHGSHATAPGSSAQGMQHIHPRQISHIKPVTAAVPKYWYYENGNLGIWPAPSGAGTYIEIFYYKYVTAYSDGANVPPHLHDFGIWYALSRWFEKEGMLGEAQQYMSYYQKMTGFVAADRRIVAIDSINSMKFADYTRAPQG